MCRRSVAGPAWRAVLAAVALYGFALQLFAAGFFAPGPEASGYVICAPVDGVPGPSGDRGGTAQSCCTAACAPAVPIPVLADDLGRAPERATSAIGWRGTTVLASGPIRRSSPQARAPPTLV